MIIGAGNFGYLDSMGGFFSPSLGLCVCVSAVIDKELKCYFGR